MPRLSEIEPAELSLVHRGAIRRSFNVRKAADALPAETLTVLDTVAKGEDELVNRLADVDVEKGRALVAAFRLISEHTAAQPAAIAKAMTDLADCEDEPELDSNGDPVEKAKYSADQLRAMAKSGAALPDQSYPIGDKDDLQKAIHAVGRGKNNSHADIRAHIAKRAKALGATNLLPAEWNVSKEDSAMPDTATVPVKKEDGTWDLSAVPEDQHEFMKELLEKADRTEAAEAEKVALEKAAADAETSKSDALKTAQEALEKADRIDDEMKTKDFIAKAEQLGEPDEFGPVLKAIAGAVDEETFGKLEGVLKANHARAVAAGFYKEIGRGGNGSGESSAKAQLDEKAAEIRKSDTGLSAEQALTKAYEQNPELYSQLRTEEN